MFWRASIPSPPFACWAIALITSTPNIFYNPCATLIDRKGVIRGQYPGGDPIFDGDQEANFRNKIGPLLKEKK